MKAKKKRSSSGLMIVRKEKRFSDILSDFRGGQQIITGYWMKLNKYCLTMFGNQSICPERKRQKGNITKKESCRDSHGILMK